MPSQSQQLLLLFPLPFPAYSGGFRPRHQSPVLEAPSGAAMRAIKAAVAGPSLARTRGLDVRGLDARGEVLWSAAEEAERAAFASVWGAADNRRAVEAAVGGRRGAKPS